MIGWRLRPAQCSLRMRNSHNNAQFMPDSPRMPSILRSAGIDSPNNLKYARSQSLSKTDAGCKQMDYLSVIRDHLAIKINGDNECQTETIQYLITYNMPVGLLSPTPCAYMCIFQF